MSQNIKYIAIDFETTGLDVTRDDVIQIGIIVMNDQLQYESQYSSYIKPIKNIDKLKDCVSLITGLDLQNVANAPDSDEVFESVRSIFIANEFVLIGHNVDFDARFLYKYLPELEKHPNNLGQIDTFDISQRFLPYMTSYSLETIHNYLTSNIDYAEIFQNIKKNIVWQFSHHDALFDSLSAISLFIFVVQRLSKISTDFNLPVLDRIKVAKWDDFDTFVGDISIPKLQKPIANTNIKIKFSDDIQVLTDTFELQASRSSQIQKLNIWDIGLESFLKILICSTQKYILAVSNVAKIDKIKGIFKKLWRTNFGFLNKDQNIDHDKLRQFWANNNVNSSELFFLYKYFVHYEKGLSLIDIRTDDEKLIIFLLQKNIENTDYKILITTHPGFYRNITNIKQNYKDYKLLFADIDRRHNTYNAFSQQEFDFFDMMEILEKLEYFYQKMSSVNYDLEHTYEQISRLKNLVIIMSGCFFVQIHKLSANKWKHDLIINDIENQKWLEKFVLLSEKFIIKSRELLSSTDIIEEHKNLIIWIILKYKKIIWQNFKIRDKIHNNAYVYHNIAMEVRYTDFAEFVLNFDDIDTTFVSIQNRQYDKLKIDKSALNNLGDNIMFTKNDINIQKIHQVFEIVNILSKPKYENILIISGKKEESNRLISELKKKWLDKKYNILAENITGWAKKHISKLDIDEPKIVIGWYQMAMMTKTKDRKPDLIIPFCTFGSLEDLILADVARR